MARGQGRRGGEAVDRDSPRAACSCVGIGSHGISCSRESKHVFVLRARIATLITPVPHARLLGCIT
jgi:hypothetical protein